MKSFLICVKQFLLGGDFDTLEPVFDETHRDQKRDQRGVQTVFGQPATLYIYSPG